MPALRVLRRLLPMGIVLLASAVPIARVAACSCGMSDLPDMIRASDVAFVGTVVDAVDVGADPRLGGSVVRYTWDVERASGETGPEVQVDAAAGDGGSCGITFTAGQRWVILAATGVSSLETNLCSGNLLVDGMPPDQVAQLDELLPVVPGGDVGDVDGSAGADGSVPVPPLAIGAAVVAIGVVSLLAFRRPRVS